MSFNDTGYEVNRRVEEVLKYSLEKFKLDLKIDLNEYYITLYETIEREYGSPRNSHYEARTARDNTIINLLSRNVKESTFGLKIMQLAILFANKDLYKAVTDQNDPLSDDQIAYAFGTTIENVKLKKAFDKAVKNYEKGNKNKPKQLIKN